MRPIIFMHIAKTAGSYVNQAFEAALGSAQTLLHAETRFGEEGGLNGAFARGVRYFSGHIYLGGWQTRLRGFDGDPMFLTTIRPPIDHIASHLQWLDHYTRSDQRARYEALSDGLKRLVDKVGYADFDDAGDLDHLLTNLDPTGMQMLDNCQSRYFLCGPVGPLMPYDPLTLAHRKALRRALNTFDLIMRQDQLELGLRAASALTDVALSPPATRVNAAKSPRRIDLNNQTIRGVLAKRSQVDLWLWRTVLGEQAFALDAAQEGGARQTQRAAE